MSEPGYFKQPVDLDTQRYRDKIDIKYIFNIQVLRCLQYAGTEMYPPAVTSLQKLLPMASYQFIDDNIERFKVLTPKLEYENFCGLRIGSRTNPIRFDDSQPVKRLEDGSIDWTDPNILSPKLGEDEEAMDYELLFRAILEEADNIGLLWDQITVDEPQDTGRSPPMSTPSFLDEEGNVIQNT